MKKLFSFLIITVFMFVLIEIFNAEDLSMTSQDISSNFTPDALASLREDAQGQSKGDSTRLDSTTLLLLASGLIGLAGLGRKRRQ